MVIRKTMAALTRRVLSTAITVVLLFLLFAACGSNNAVSPEKKGATAYTKEKDDTTLTVLYTGTANDSCGYSNIAPPTKAGSYTVTVTLADDPVYFGTWTDLSASDKMKENAS